MERPPGHLQPDPSPQAKLPGRLLVSFQYLHVQLAGGAPWGFTLRGGLEHGEPLIVSKVSLRRSLPGERGLRGFVRREVQSQPRLFVWPPRVRLPAQAPLPLAGWALLALPSAARLAPSRLLRVRLVRREPRRAAARLGSGTTSLRFWATATLRGSEETPALRGE